MSSRHQATHLDAGFVSPLSSEKSSSAGKNLAFSPSIFLSRPDHMSISDHAPNTTHSSTSSGPTPNKSESSAPPRIRFSVSPGSESDSHALSDTEGASFITSTPIKSGKENTMRGGSDSDEMWSPTILLTKRHRHLKETNEVRERGERGRERGERGRERGERGRERGERGRERGERGRKEGGRGGKEGGRGGKEGGRGGKREGEGGKREGERGREERGKERRGKKRGEG